MRSTVTRERCSGRATDRWPYARRRSNNSSTRRSSVAGEQVLGGAYGVSGPNPLWAQGLLGLAGFLIFGMRY
jgi:hypothetical protein